MMASVIESEKSSIAIVIAPRAFPCGGQSEVVCDEKFKP
jgi:hypothetical protein